MSSKIVEQIGKLSVLELAELLKNLQDTFGVSAAMPAAASSATAGAPAAVVEEKTEFRVTLKDSGSEKIKVIKALREVTTFDLKRAKEIADTAPCVIVEAAPKDTAAKMKEKLEAAGAKVELA